MTIEKSLPLAGNQGRGAGKDGNVCAISTQGGFPVSVNSIPQPTHPCQVTSHELKNVNMSILELADRCLQEFNKHWAAWIANGDDTAFRLAMNAKADRDNLLAQLGGGR